MLTDRIDHTNQYIFTQTQQINHLLCFLFLSIKLFQVHLHGACIWVIVCACSHTMSVAAHRTCPSEGTMAAAGSPVSAPFSGAIATQDRRLTRDTCLLLLNTQRLSRLLLLSWFDLWLVVRTSVIHNNTCFAAVDCCCCCRCFNTLRCMHHIFSFWHRKSTSSWRDAIVVSAPAAEHCRFYPHLSATHTCVYELVYTAVPAQS